jgi:hypothetical protein
VIGWQDAVVLAVVVVAIAYLVRRRVRPKQAKPELVSLGRGPKRTRDSGATGG